MEENVGNDDTKTFRRDLKKAKVFAIHYLTRRIRLLKNKKGTEQQIEKNKRKAERFQEEIECIKDLDANIVLKKIQEKLNISDIIKDGSQDVQERALARLMSSKPIQNRRKDTVDKDISSQPHSVDVLSSSKILRHTNCDKPNLKKSKNDNTPSKQETMICSDEALSETFDSSEENSDEEIKRTATSFFVKSMASLADDGRNKSSKNERKAKKEVKKASNRLGQRARQRIWKETYGYKANHVKLDEKTTRKYEKLKPDKRSKQATQSKSKQTAQETVSHPSWEASKRRKLEQNISQTQFQGKKITFEDSD